MKVLPHLPFAEGNRYNSQKRTSSGYSLLPLPLRVVTCSACFGDQYCFVWGGGMGSGLALSSTLSREAVVGREEPSSR